jgi:hypothetical protein
MVATVSLLLFACRLLQQTVTVESTQGMDGTNSKKQEVSEAEGKLKK